MLLVIDNYDSFTFNLVQALEAAGAETRVVRNDAVTVDAVRALAPRAVVISPGPGTPADAGVCVELVRELAADVPILGVCLGHQAITEAFGGRVVRAAAPMHGKTSRVYHARRGLFAGMPLPFAAGRYHSLVVERRALPDCLRVEADTADGTIMAIRHADHPCHGLQFHPESILTPQGDRLLRNFLAAVESFTTAAKEAEPCFAD